MGNWGQKKAATRRSVVAKGGTLPGGQAKKATEVGGLGDDGQVRDTRGRVIGDFRGRTKKAQNQNGV